MQLLSKYELFIFDWDHTLTTSTFIVTILNVFKSVRQLHMSNLKEAYKPDNAIRSMEMSEEVSKLYSFFDDVYSFAFRPRIKEGAIPLLELLKKKHKKIAIFSDSKAYRLMKEARMLGVLKYFDFVLSAESIDYYKPNPTGLLLVMDRVKIQKKKCVYIGDMASDVLTAKFAGIDSCAIADGIDTRVRLTDAKPNHVFGSLREFQEKVGR